MTRSVVTVDEDTPLDQVVHIMEAKRVKRLPVMRENRVVGILSRANLLRALAAMQPPVSLDASDASIRARLRLELAENFPDAGRYDVVVKDGTVDLWGTIFADRERDAIRVAAENTPGVKKVRDHFAWIEPNTGIVIESPEDAEASPYAKEKGVRAN